MIFELVLAVSCALGISTLCSLLEAGLYSLSLSRIEMMAAERPAKAAVLRKLKNNIDQPITAILTLNTVAHTMGASVAGAAAADVFGEKGLVWFSACFTLAVLLFSEILPKIIGVAFSVQLAPYMARPLELLVMVFKPVILIGQLMSSLMPKSKDNSISAEELTTVARLSRKAGEIGSDQEAVIINIIALSGKRVRQVMTPRTVAFTMSKDSTIAEAVKLQEKWRAHSRVPLYDKDSSDVVGIVRSYEVMQAAAAGSYERTLEELMIPAHFVPEIAPLDKVMLEFFERRQHLFVVVDEYGSVTGVISLEDIVEEIMGREIMDESDRTGNLRALARASMKCRSCAGG
jgi:CBS domain containing-hemolysin-like protein